MPKFKACLSIFSALLLHTGPAFGGPRPQPPGSRPRLVVLLVVDQMRADYVDQFGGNWKKGFRRLLDHGAKFTQAAYPYWNTVTCPGHATIATGALPATHGMMLNAWWDRAAGKQMDCAEDEAAATVTARGSKSPGEGPKNLQVPTLADQIREQLGPATRVVALSLKSRSAVSLAGHRGDAVIWFSSKGWTTSTFYADKLPRFVARHQLDHPPEAALGKSWKKLLPESAYLYADDGEGEHPLPGDRRTFPHKISTLNHWVASPFSDVAVGELAQAAVKDLKLGKGEGTDFLAVSFSALDSVGHNYGPRSHEVQDVLAHLDVTIGNLLDSLDHALGAENYVVALTSDHGVAPIPEQVLASGTDAGRIVTRDFVGLAEVLESYFGPGPHIQRIMYTEMYFVPGIYKKLQANPEAMRRVREAILQVPGVWRVYRGEELAEYKTGGDGDPVTRAAALGYYPGRSGDLILLSRPYWLASSAATTHGTGHRYDTHVPLVLMGPMFQAGEYSAPATPADVAPTLAHVLGIQMPEADGRVLTESLRTEAPKSQESSPPRKCPWIFHSHLLHSPGFMLDFSQ